MTISAADFKANNTVYFSCPLITEKVDGPTGYYGDVLWTTGPLDIVDTNKNYKGDYDLGGGWTKTLKFREPVLADTSIDQLRHFAQQQGTDVITEDDIAGGLRIEKLTFKTPAMGHPVFIKEDVRDISSLKTELGPLPKGVKWAINFNPQYGDGSEPRFMLFAPKQAMP